MNHKIVSLLVTATLGVLAFNEPAFAQGTAFTYQGRLNAGGGLASGNFDFTFALFNNSSTNAGQVASTLTNLNVGVTNGLFTVLLDFGPGVFTGGSNWLAIAVRTNGGTSFTALSPLQKLTPTPYTIYAANAGTASSANSVAGSNIVGTILSANIANNTITSNQLASNIGAWTRIGSNIVYNSGNVGIGTNTPEGSLIVQGVGASSTSGAITGIQTSGSPYSGGVVGLSFAPGSSGVFGESDVPYPGGSGPGGGNAGVFGFTYSTNGTALLGQAAAPNGVTYGVVGIVFSPDGYAGYFGGNVAVTGILSGNGSGLINLNAAQLTSVGNNNFFTGSAGNAATTGGFNTAYGSSALKVNTGGTANNAFGVNALGANTSGNYNSAFGGFTLVNNKSGTGNTADGHVALANNTTGDYNTALGYGTLYNNTSGSGNIAIGYNAGVNFTANDSSNIDIGNLGVAGESGVIRIGTPGTHIATIIAGVINGNGAGLTNLSASALPANVALLSSNQTFTGSNSFSGPLSVTNSANNSGIILYDTGLATSFAVRNTSGTALAELGVAAATGNYSVNANPGDITLRASMGGTQKLILQAGSGSANIIISNTTTTVLGTFNNNSDRDAKQDFAPVSPSEMLDKVTHLPLSQWSYKTEAGTRHVGPMAQDFYSAFNVGTDDRHIAPIDEGGVSLAAIQGLNQKVDDQAKTLEEQLREKDAEIQELKQRLNRLEKMFLQLGGRQPGS